MRDKEKPVCGIAAETIAYMVEQAAEIHLPQCPFRHFKRLFVTVPVIFLQKEQQVMGHGKFRRLPEAAVFFIKALPVGFHRTLDQAYVTLNGGAANGSNG